MRLRKIPWRFLLPGVIFPMSVATWVQYYLSVRASDDSPAPWYWFGSPISAWLNFPAYVYSAPAQPLARFGVRLGRLWVQPRIVTFFLLVLVFWYWIGIRLSLGERRRLRIQWTKSQAGPTFFMRWARPCGYWLLSAPRGTLHLLYIPQVGIVSATFLEIGNYSTSHSSFGL